MWGKKRQREMDYMKKEIQDLKERCWKLKCQAAQTEGRFLTYLGVKKVYIEENTTLKKID